MLASDFSFTILNILSDGHRKFGFNALKYNYSSSFLNEKGFERYFVFDDRRKVNF